MSWVTIIWSMDAAICLTLAAIYFAVWLHSRNVPGYLFFTLSAVGSSGIAAFELLLLRSENIERYNNLDQLSHIPLALLIISIVWFTRFHLRAGWLWLGWTVTATRVLVMVINLFSHSSFKNIIGLHRIPFWGETISTPEAMLNTWSFLGKWNSMLLLVFLITATLGVLRHKKKRLDVFLCGSMVFFITAAALHAALLERGIVQTPYFISFSFLGVLLAMAYGLSSDVLHASQLVQKLQVSEAGLRESEERMTLAAEAVNLGIWVNDLVKREIWASDKWRAMFGFRKSERIDLDGILQRLHPEDRERLIQHARTVLDIHRGATERTAGLLDKLISRAA